MKPGLPMKDDRSGKLQKNAKTSLPDEESDDVEIPRKLRKTRFAQGGRRALAFPTAAWQ